MALPDQTSYDRQNSANSQDHGILIACSATGQGLQLLIYRWELILRGPIRYGREGLLDQFPQNRLVYVFQLVDVET